MRVRMSSKAYGVLATEYKLFHIPTYHGKSRATRIGVSGGEGLKEPNSARRIKTTEGDCNLLPVMG